MADRSVKVILRADASSLVNGLKQSERATQDFADKSSKTASSHKASWGQVGPGMMVAGGALAVGVGFAVKAFMGFDKEMSNVAAVSGATAGEMDKLRAAALKAGADTKFSAAEAATAQAELAKAGVSTADILGGALTGSLNLAAAGNLDLGNAAEISAQAMNIFKLEGKDVSHIADVLAASANKSAADVGGMGDALKQGGLVAAQTGLSLESTVGTLSAFADSALVGSDAGTSLKTMLQRLVPTSDAAQGAMDEIGFSAYDAQGKFVGMESVAQQLKEGLGGLTEKQRAGTLATIFGSDAVRAASVLYDQGAAGIAKYTKEVNDQDAATRMAAIQLDNLAGDLEGLKGSIETALIQAGSGGNDALRGMAQFATEAVNAFGELPPPMQKSALGLAAVASGGLLVVGAIGTMYPKLVEARQALRDLAGSSEIAGNTMSRLGKVAGVATALAAVAAAAAALNNAFQEPVPGIEATTAALLNSGDAAKNVDVLFKGLEGPASFLGGSGDGIDDITAAFKRLTETSGLDSLSDTVDSFFGAINGATKSAEVFQNIGTSLGALVTSGHAKTAATQFDAMAAKLGLSGDETKQLMGLMPAYGESLAAVANKTKLAGVAAAGAKGPTKALAVSEDDLKKAADAAKTAHDALTASISGFGSAMMAARGDARSYEAAIDAAAASVKENGRTLDITTEKGRSNAGALDAIASAALKSAQSNLEAAETNGTLARSSVTVAAQVGKARTAFINSAVSMGMNRTAAGKLATQAGLTAGRVQGITDKLLVLGGQKPKPKVDVEKAAAEAKIKAFQAQINAIKGKKVTTDVEKAAAAAKVAALQRQIDNLRGKAVKVTASVDGVDQVSSLQRYINGLKSKKITLTVAQVGGLNKRAGMVAGMADGGYVTGPGTTTSDSIPLWGSDGEYMVKAAAVEKYGVGTMDAINAMRFAAGGPVGSAPSTSGNLTVDMGGVRADLAEQTGEIRKLVRGFGSELDRQARTIQTMQRQMTGA